MIKNKANKKVEDNIEDELTPVQKIEYRQIEPNEFWNTMNIIAQNRKVMVNFVLK